MEWVEWKLERFAVELELVGRAATLAMDAV